MSEYDKHQEYLDNRRVADSMGVEGILNLMEAHDKAQGEVARLNQENKELETKLRKMTDKAFQQGEDLRYLGGTIEMANKTIDSLRGSWRDEKAARDKTTEDIATMQAALTEQSQALALARQNADAAAELLRIQGDTCERYKQAIEDARQALSNQTHGNAQYQPDVLEADSILAEALNSTEQSASTESEESE